MAGAIEAPPTAETLTGFSTGGAEREKAKPQNEGRGESLKRVSHRPAVMVRERKDEVNPSEPVGVVGEDRGRSG